MSTKSHVTHRTPKHRPITKLTASAIALSVLLSPLELPLSDLASHPEDFFVDESSAKDIYEQSQSGELVLEKDDTITFTRTLGETDTASLGEAPALVITPPLSAEVMAPAVAIEPEPVAVQRLMQRSKRGENILAAQAIATGDTHSELTSVTLDAEGNITQTKDLHGGTRKAEYDEAGRPIRVTNADGTESYYSYNAKGQVTSVSHTAPRVAEGPIKTILATIANPLWALADDTDSASFFYDEDNIATVRDSSGAVSYEYDEDGLLISETYPDGSGVEYGYDELGNVVSTEEFDSDTKQFSFASFLRKSYASPLSVYLSETASYNDNNQLATYGIVEVTESVSSVEPTETDTISTTTPPIVVSTEVVASTSVPVESVETIEATTTQEIPEVDTTVKEDSSTLQDVIEQVTETVATYISATTDRLAVWFGDSITRAWADVVAVTTDTTSVTASTSTPLYEISYTYDAQGNVIESRTSTGIVTTFVYDSKTDALLGKTVTTRARVTHTQTYEVDAMARIVAKDGIPYEYSDNGMLLKVGDATYTYDDAGNRISQSGVAGAQYTYSGNRLHKVEYENGRAVSYAYDERGAVVAITDTEEGVTEFSYTPAGAIETMSLNGFSVSYTYDALGRRVNRTSTTDGEWTYQYNGNLLKRVVDAQGVVLREYFYTPTGELAAVKAGGSLFQVITSDNKSIVGVVAVSTGELFTQSYDTWGTVTQSNIPFPLDIGYIGAFTETNFGLSVFGPRVYDPELGRFLSKDPLPGTLLDGLSQNEYIYAKNDPVHQYDPSGHASEIAQKSDSPKRAIVETKAALELLRQDEDATRQTYTDLQSVPRSELTDFMGYQQELLRAQAAFEAANDAVESLEILLSLQVAAVAENEQSAVMSPEVSPEVVVGEELRVEVGVASTSEEVVADTATQVASTTIEADSISLPTLDAVAESESASSSPSVSTTMLAGVLAVASVIFSDQLLTAEAKKKKSKAKAKKSKKKSSSKAKAKQSKKAKELAKMKKQIDSIQKKLLAMKAVVDKRVAVEKEEKQRAANVLRNIEATTAAQVAKLNAAPQKPATSFTSNNAVCGITMSCAPSSASVTVPILAYAPTQPASVTQHFTTQNAHIALTACSFEQTFIGAACGLADGILYATEGDWLGAGLSAGSAIPLIGATADFAKMFKVAAAATRSALLGARNVPEFLALADARKIADASAGNVKVLHGTTDDAKAVFEAQTKGWSVIHQSNDVVAKVSLDGKYSIGFRTKSTDPARGSVSKINGTIDVQEFEVLSNGFRKPKGDLIEVKFAE